MLSERTRRRGVVLLALCAGVLASCEGSADRPDPHAELGLPPRPSREIRPAVSPDGEYLAFNSDRGGVMDIYVMELATGDIRQLTKNQGNNYLPRWSPDGTRLSFYSNYRGNPWSGDIEHDVYVMNRDGTDLHAVVTDPSQDMFADWLPGGRGLVFASTRASAQHIHARKTLFTLDFASEEVVRLLPGGIDFSVFQPSVHIPTGNIVFEGDIDGNSDLWILEAESGEVRRLTSTPEDEYGPALSPDGTLVLFQVAHGNGQIGLVGTDGTGYRVVTSEGNYTTPRWTPEGDIVTTYDDPESADPVLSNWNLYRMKADGTGRVLLLDW